MLVPFATLPKPLRTWLTVGLLILAVATGCLMTYAVPRAQPLVLYDATPVRAFLLPQLVSVADSTKETWAGLKDIRLRNDELRELLLVLADDLFAAGYGVGMGLLCLMLSELASRRPHLPDAVAALLRFAAACYPVAGVFDLIENQITAILVFLPASGVGELLIIIARYSAIPKYDLSILVGPATAVLAGVIALLSSVTADRAGATRA